MAGGLRGPPQSLREMAMTKPRSWRWWALAALIHLGILAAASIALVEESPKPVDDSAAREVLISCFPLGKKVDGPLPADEFYRRGLPSDSCEEDRGLFFPEAGKRPGVYDTMGVGGGGGGAGRFGMSSDGESSCMGELKGYTSYIKGEAGGFRGRVDE